MTLARESEVTITKKSDTEIEITDDRDRPQVRIRIPGVYGMRRENSPVTAELTTPTPNTSYYVYAKQPNLPWGSSPRASTGFDIVISTDSELIEKHKFLGSIQTDANGDIMDAVVGGEPESETLLDVPVKVDLGSTFKEGDTIQLDQIPDTATKAILDVVITSVEKESSSIKLFVPDESKHIASVSAPRGETRGEETVKIPITDAQNTIRYRIDRDPISSRPKSSIKIVGWVE